ncbi:hypothetical protein [Tunturibacter empetritectus]|uniref:Cobalamin biosynthesis protein CobT n=1 Tax=Tunturiibacter lichenicola TaxID=2051959 RepID=A0A7W8J8K9_9BACT|nr:hypothetical protein [Edaphobacter lichenicola]MBB5344632.1 cobalamin biosynthesis protein CobT [Edaphobacter lichenicola]
MADALNNQEFDEILHKIGPDATAMFDNSTSNPTEHASSDATNAATAVDDDEDDDELEEEDDDAAEEEEDDEDNEEEDVEDEAGV